MLLLKTKRPSTLTGRNFRLSNRLISSCLILSFNDLGQIFKFTTNLYEILFVNSCLAHVTTSEREQCFSSVRQLK